MLSFNCDRPSTPRPAGVRLFTCFCVIPRTKTTVSGTSAVVMLNISVTKVMCSFSQNANVIPTLLNSEFITPGHCVFYSVPYL